MAAQVIYKNIGIEDEATWGASTGGIQRVLQITSSTLGRVPNKTLVEETSTSLKGRNRIVSLQNEVGGDLVAFADPKIIHNFLKYVNGGAGATAAVGSSAMQITYNQNTDGNMLSFTEVQDRNNTQEKFQGLRASKLSLNASDGIVEGTLSLMGTQRITGVSVPDTVGVTFKPMIFADAVITFGLPGFTQTSTLQVSEWSLEYDNQLERSYLSGSRNAARLDPKIAMLTGTFKYFHTGNSYIDPTFGNSEMYVRVELLPDSSAGLIAGVTPHYLQIDMPRCEIVTNERNYEQNALSTETITINAMFDPGISALWRPRFVVGLGIET